MLVKDYIATAIANLVDKDRNGETIVVIKDDAPQWVTDMARKAHGNMMPDDMRFKMIREVLSCMAGHVEADTEHDGVEFDLDHDVRHEVCDGLVDVYTSALTAWLGSHIERPGYCDEAIREYGSPDADDDINKRISMGQFAEYEEIFGSIVDSIANVEPTEGE